MPGHPVEAHVGQEDPIGDLLLAVRKDLVQLGIHPVPDPREHGLISEICREVEEVEAPNHLVAGQERSLDGIPPLGRGLAAPGQDQDQGQQEGPL